MYVTIASPVLLAAMRAASIRLAIFVAACVCLCPAGRGALLTNFAGSYALYQQCTLDGADFDADGDVDGADFMKWQRGVGLTGQVNNSQGDADLNGFVDDVDLAHWFGNFGATGGMPDALCFKLYFDPAGIIEGDVTAVLDVPSPITGEPRLGIDVEELIAFSHPQYRVSVLDALIINPPGRQRLEVKVRFTAREPASPPAGPITIFGLEVHDNQPQLGVGGAQVGFEFKAGNFITLFDSDTGQTTTFNDAQLPDVPLLLERPLLQGDDAILAIDVDPPASNSSYFGAGPAGALDGAPGTVYRNFAGRNSGLIVTPAVGPTIVQSMRLTSANDDPDGDPAAWALYGTNDVILSQDNSNGMGEGWTLIGSGQAMLPDARGADSPVLPIANQTPYASYRIVFPELKNFRDAGAMHIADVELFNSPTASGAPIALPTDDARAIHLPTSQANSPPANGPENAIDGDPGSKYENLGKENAGFIVTPGVGASIVKSFVITTADDVPGRDPASWVLFGTNDVILSGNFSQGAAENWILIDSGTLTLPDERLSEGPRTVVDGARPFLSYRMVFPTVKNPAGHTVDSVQFADIQFYGILPGAAGPPMPEPASLALIGWAVVAAGARRVDDGARRRGPALRTAKLAASSTT